MFDIKLYLEHKQVDFWEGGKNVSRGWINLECLFCQDPSNHMGVNLEGEYFHCWICGESGPVSLVVQRLENNCSTAQANTVMAKWQMLELEEEGEPYIPLSADVLPKGLLREFPMLHKEYLRNDRGFNPGQLIRDYDLRAIWTMGEWKFRIIAPITLNKQVVNFIALDVTEQAKSKYKICPNERAIIPARHLLYNIDSLQDRVIIVEGITDVWRVGAGAVATFGVEYTQEQISLLRNRDLKSAVVVFDGEEEAIRKAHKLARNLFFIPSVEVIELEDDRDPDDLNEEEIRELKGE